MPRTLPRRHAAAPQCAMIACSAAVRATATAATCKARHDATDHPSNVCWAPRRNLRCEERALARSMQPTMVRTCAWRGDATTHMTHVQGGAWCNHGAIASCNRRGHAPAARGGRAWAHRPGAHSLLWAMRWAPLARILAGAQGRIWARAKRDHGETARQKRRKSADRPTAHSLLERLTFFSVTATFISCIGSGTRLRLGAREGYHLPHRGQSGPGRLDDIT